MPNRTSDIITRHNPLIKIIICIEIGKCLILFNNIIVSGL